MRNIKPIKLNLEHKLFLRSILIMLLGSLLDFGQRIVSINLPIVRYFIYFVSFFYLSKGIIYSIDLNRYSNLFKIIVFSFLAWIIVTLLRGIPKITDGYGGYLYLKRFISGDLVILFLPFLILIKPSLVFYQRLIKYSYNMALAGCFIVPFVFILFKLNPGYGIEFLTRLFVSSGSIILLTTFYHSRKKILVVSFAFTISLIILLLLARRNMIVYFVSVITFSFIIWFANNNITREIKKYVLISLLIIGFVLGAIFLISKNNFTYAIERFSTGFESRDGIIDELTDDFNKHPSDWIFGRGFYGEFHTKTLALNLDKGSRDGIENGYLNHILIGGWLYLGLLIAISIPAIYLGFFRSKNTLSKAFASIILIYFIDMVGFGLPDLTIKYLIIWIAISGCYSPYLRNISDLRLRIELNRKD